MQSGQDVLIDVRTASEEGLVSGKFAFDQMVVLYSKIRPYLRKVVRPGFSGLCSADVYPLTANNDLISRDYLYYTLVSEQFTAYAEKGSARSGMPKVNREHLFSYLVSLPNITEQRLIVALLDKAFAEIAAAIRNTERILANVEDLFQSELNLILQRSQIGEAIRLGAAVASVSTGPFGSMLHKADYVSGGFPLVNPINIRGDAIVPDENKTVDRATADRLQSYVLRAGDVVVGRRGEMGRCAVVPASADRWLCGTGSFFIRPSDRLRSDYLALLIRSPSFKSRLEKVASGMAMKNLSNLDVQDLLVVVPSLDEQERTVAKVNNLRQLMDEWGEVQKSQLSALADLKKSLLALALSGELTREPLAA